MRKTQGKGGMAVAQAIASFTKAGYDVSLPLTESAPYDLIADTGLDLKRVQGAVHELAPSRPSANTLQLTRLCRQAGPA